MIASYYEFALRMLVWVVGGTGIVCLVIYVAGLVLCALSGAGESGSGEEEES